MSTQTNHLTGWDEWYRETHDIIVDAIGRIDAVTQLNEKKTLTKDQRSTVGVMSYVKELYTFANFMLDALDRHNKQTVTNTKRISQLLSKVEQRDLEITKNLELILEWKKNYQPTLDEAKKYFEDKAGRIGKP